jgi:hypothetical protein
MTNVMQKFFLKFISLFRAFYKPVITKLFQPGPDADTVPRRLEPLPNLYTVPLEDGLKESPEHVRQNKEGNKQKTFALSWSLYNFVKSPFALRSVQNI